jgi:NADP-dependent 3-hydroxy acid dehydrogenase YdfG
MLCFQRDINDYEFCEEVTSKVISEFGKIDILVNNAGIQFPSKNIEELEEKISGQHSIQISSE